MNICFFGNHLPHDQRDNMVTEMATEAVIMKSAAEEPPKPRILFTTAQVHTINKTDQPIMKKVKRSKDFSPSNVAIPSTETDNIYVLETEIVTKNEIGPCASLGTRYNVLNVNNP